MSRERRVALIHLGKKTASADQIAIQLQQAGLAITEVNIGQKSDSGSLHKALNEDVVVVNLGSFDFDPGELIEQISTAYGDQIIINDAQIVDRLTGWERKRWLRHLLHKIDPAYSMLPVEPLIVTSPVDLADVEAVWVLAASIGGPESVREFLSVLPADVPFLFILAQHLGGDFQITLCNQLAGATSLKVEIPWPGMSLRSGMVVLAPAREKLLATPEGRVELQPLMTDSALTPSIDAVCETAIAQFKPVHMAVFSGMSTDGVAGAEQVVAAGGEVIVQTPESTVVDSIIQGVKARMRPAFEGTPAQMAEYLLQSVENNTTRNEQ